MGVHPLLPSHLQVGENAAFAPFHDFECVIFGCIHAVHFYEGKVKYDMELHGPEAKTTRIYNVDSAFVVKEETAHDMDIPEKLRIYTRKLRKFLGSQPNPHLTVIVTADLAELLSGEATAHSLPQALPDRHDPK